MKHHGGYRAKMTRFRRRFVTGWFRAGLLCQCIQGGALAVLVVSLIVFVTRRWHGEGGAHTFAETVGGVGSFVGAVLVAMTLFLQSQELKLQRRELQLQRREVALTREAMERQTAESHEHTQLWKREHRTRMPKLAICFREGQQYTAHSSYVMQLKNLGSTPLTTLRVEFDAALAFATASIDVNGEVNVLSLNASRGAPDGGISALRDRTQSVTVSAVDEVGESHRWKFPIEEFQDGKVTVHLSVANEVRSAEAQRPAQR